MPAFKSTNFKDMKPGDVYRDDRVKGLQLRRRGSTTTWELYYVFKGVQRRPKLSTWPTLDLHAARAVARTRLEQVAAGVDFSQERKAARAAPTVADLAALFVAEKKTRVALKTYKPRSLEEIERHLRLHILPRMGNLKARDVTHTHAANLIARIAQKNPTNANRVRATLSGLFRFAEHPDRKIRPPHSNPVYGVHKSREESRRRYATELELAALWKSFEHHQPQYPREVAALIVILLSGTRVTELITAKRAEYLGDVIVRKDHKTMRTGQDRVIALPVQARKLIEALPADGSDFLFGAGLSRNRIFVIWEKIRNAAGCADLTIVDLRRTFATYALSNGTDLKQIGTLLGHRDLRTTQRYARLMPEAALRIANQTADLMADGMVLPIPLPAATPRFRGFRRVIRQKQRIEPGATDPALPD